MNHISRSLFCFSFVFFAGRFLAQEAVSDFPLLEGPYLGQRPPGMKAEVFAPGIISKKGSYEGGATFSPDASIFIFKRAFMTITAGEEKWHEEIWISEMRNGRWVEPYRAPFDNVSTNWDFSFARRDDVFYFTSRRPAFIDGEQARASNIWKTEPTPSGWSDPISMDYPVNVIDSYSGYPTLTTEGTIYFHSRREDGLGEVDLYRARLVDGSYPKVENVGLPINSPYREFDPCITPDESAIIFISNRITQNMNAAHIFISFRNGEAAWTEPVPMNDVLGDVRLPNISADGKYFFFAKQTGERADDVDIFWVDTKIFEQFRPGKIKSYNL